MQAMEEIIAKLPRGIGFEWSGISYQERMARAQAPILYAFSVFVIFLCLAALYESWPIPISILFNLAFRSYWRSYRFELARNA